MNPQTFGHVFDMKKVLPIQCVKNDTLKDLAIRNSCFLLSIIYDGVTQFQVGDLSFEVKGPCIVCFDESDSPKLISHGGIKCDSIYFNPTFLDDNMTFSRIHEGKYNQIALIHNLFLLKPFTDKFRYEFSMFDKNMDKLKQLFSLLENELEKQPDSHWPCRSKSYFLEIMLLLERIYGLTGRDDHVGST